MYYFTQHVSCWVLTGLVGRTGVPRSGIQSAWGLIKPAPGWLGTWQSVWCGDVQTDNTYIKLQANEALSTGSTHFSCPKSINSRSTTYGPWKYTKLQPGYSWMRSSENEFLGNRKVPVDEGVKTDPGWYTNRLSPRKRVGGIGQRVSLNHRVEWSFARWKSTQ